MIIFFIIISSFSRLRVLEEIERCDCPHFLLLFRDSRLQFRGLYAFYPDTEEVSDERGEKKLKGKERSRRWTEYKQLRVLCALHILYIISDRAIKK